MHKSDPRPSDTTIGAFELDLVTWEKTLQHGSGGDGTHHLSKYHYLISNNIEHR